MPPDGFSDELLNKNFASRRVVVTGLGCISPVGVTVTEAQFEFAGRSIRYRFLYIINLDA
jgi:hypothetical protein